MIKTPNSYRPLILYVSRRGYKIAKPLEKIGVKCTTVVCDGGLFTRLQSFAIYFRALLKADAPLVITDTAQNIGILVWIGARLFKVPVVYRVRGDTVTECREKGQKFHEHFYRKYYLPYCTHIIPVSKYLKAKMLEQNLPISAKCTVIPTPQHIASNQQKTFEDRNRIILIAGSFRLWSKTKELVDAIQPLDSALSNLPEYIVQLAGGGRYLDVVKKAIQGMKNKERIEVMGKVENIQQYYMNARVLLYLSGLDSFPSVINEARACGLPVVTTPCQGMKEQIQDGIDGYFVEDIEQDIPGIIRELEEKNNWNRISDNGLKTVRNEYAPDLIGKRFVEVFSKVS